VAPVLQHLDPAAPPRLRSGAQHTEIPRTTRVSRASTQHPFKEHVMNPIHRSRWMVTTLAAITLTAVVHAQPQETHQPSKPAEHTAPATKTDKTDKRIGGPYALDTCPISGKK